MELEEALAIAAPSALSASRLQQGRAGSPQQPQLDMLSPSSSVAQLQQLSQQQQQSPSDVPRATSQQASPAEQSSSIELQLQPSVHHVLPEVATQQLPLAAAEAPPHGNLLGVLSPQPGPLLPQLNLQPQALQPQAWPQAMVEQVQASQQLGGFAGLQGLQQQAIMAGAAPLVPTPAGPQQQPAALDLLAGLQQQARQPPLYVPVGRQLTRLCLKLMDCLPEELPPASLARVMALMVGDEADLVQVRRRRPAGCWAAGLAATACASSSLPRHRGSVPLCVLSGRPRCQLAGPAQAARPQQAAPVGRLALCCS
jgi:hypothetical protein